MKKKITDTVAVLLIIAVSVLFGWIYTRYDHNRELKEYPRGYQSTVAELSYGFNVPASRIYASVKVRSDFDPALVSDDGKTGLFQLTAEQYGQLSSGLGEEPASPGLLFEPATSLRLGTYWMSLLYERYSDWNAVYAAMAVGTDIVDTWMADPSAAPDGKLTNIPDPATAEYVKKTAAAAEKYLELYETAKKK